MFCNTEIPVLFLLVTFLVMIKQITNLTKGTQRSIKMYFGSQFEGKQSPEMGRHSRKHLAILRRLRGWTLVFCLFSIFYFLYYQYGTAIHRMVSLIFEERALLNFLWEYPKVIFRHVLPACLQIKLIMKTNHYVPSKFPSYLHSFKSVVTVSSFSDLYWT